MVNLTIDGKQISVKEGTLIIEAAEANSIYIPRFCSHKKLFPDGNCRICLVQIEKQNKLVTSCTTPVAEGMVVYTNNELVLSGRQAVMTGMLANHPLDCPVCDQGGECDLQDIAELYTPTVGSFREVKRTFPKTYISPYIEKELNRCITCVRCVRYCDQVMEVRALGTKKRGTQTEITTFMGKELQCEFCGGCVEICPVGALTNKIIQYTYRPWHLEKSLSICPNCADGCTFNLHVRDEKFMRVTYSWQNGRNEGSLCAKGYYGLFSANDRLKTPLAKKHKKLVEENWKQALSEVAEKLKKIISANGENSVAGFISGRAINEDIYMFQRFFRDIVKTNNIDSTLSYGTINSFKALKKTLGSIEMMNSFEEIQAANNIIYIGNFDLFETNPIVGYKVKAAVRRNKANLAVISQISLKSPRSRISRIAQTKIMTSRPLGSIVTALTSIIGKSDNAAAEKYKNMLSSIKSEQVSGIEKEFESQLSAIKNLLLSEGRTVIIVGDSIAEEPNGYELCLNIIELAIMTGLIEKEGSGVNFLCEETNAQGLAHFGAGPDFLPGFLPLEGNDPLKFPARPGADLSKIINGILDGNIKALFITEEDIVSNLPASSRIKEALSSLELLVVMDTYFTATCEFADYIFPMAAFAEREGSFTNVEGRVQKFPRKLQIIGSSLSGWQVYSKLATEMGEPLLYKNIEDFRTEFSSLMKREKTDRAHITSAADNYLSSVQSGAFSKRHMIGDEKRLLPYKLLTGPVLFHSGRRTTGSKLLSDLSKNNKLFISSADAEKLGIEQDDLITLSNNIGSVKLTADLTLMTPEGTVFYPEHNPILELMETKTGSANNSLSFNTTYVNIEKIK